MVWLPLIGIVGAVVVAAVVKARAEVHTEQEERVYKEEQDLAKEERQAQRKAEELAAQRAYDEVRRRRNVRTRRRARTSRRRVAMPKPWRLRPTRRATVRRRTSYLITPSSLGRCWTGS